jgi:nitrogen regulatory protein PII
MKEISHFIPTYDLEQATALLRRYNVGGITFYEIDGAGRRLILLQTKLEVFAN